MTEHPAVEALRGAMQEAGARFFFDTTCSRFRAPILGDALALWREKAGDDVAPKRRALTPHEMRAFLKRVAMIERVDQKFGPCRYRARVTGQEFTLAYTDMTGKFLDEAVPAPFYRRWKAVLDTVLKVMTPLRGVLVPEAFNRDHSVLEILLAPLLDDEGKANQVLCVANFERGRAWADVEAEEAKYQG